jgi:diacylglycerol kinase (ATP)
VNSGSTSGELTVNQMPAEACHILIAVNATAGSGKRHKAVVRLADHLRQHGLNCEQIDSLEALSQRADQLLKAGNLRAVVAAGGDGTVAEIVNRTVPDVPIAVFPLGTENLLAKYLWIDHDPEAFAQLVAQGRTVWLDAGRANGRLFLLMASVGFDAEVVRRFHAERDGNISHWSYAKPILQTIRSYQYPELRIKCATAPSGADSMAEHSETIRCRWAFVFNLPKYGGGLKFAPLANGTDGQLDVCAFQRGGLLSGLRYLAAVVLGRHQNLREFNGWQGIQLHVEADVPVPYELDGDPGGMLPLTIEVVPKRVRVLVSTHWQVDGKSPA